MAGIVGIMPARACLQYLAGRAAGAPSPHCKGSVTEAKNPARGQSSFFSALNPEKGPSLTGGRTDPDAPPSLTGYFFMQN